MRVRVLPLGLLLMSLACSAGDSQLPAPYRNLRVPTQRIASSAARQAGKQLFLEHCAICHGKEANGRGPRHAYLSNTPVDFTRDAWRESTTPKQTYFRIREGVPGTSMPSWKSLSSSDCWDLTAYVLSVSKEGP